MYELSLELIRKSSEFLKGKVRKTPVEFSPVLSDLLNAPVYLKLENLQLTGSFKVRGALFYLSTLSDKEKAQGVAACSAGNHGLGVAYAAKEMGVDCTIYVPKSVDQAKHQKMLKLGAKVVRSEFVGYDDTLEWAEKEAAEKHLPLISAFDDERIMAANGGSLAIEILSDIPQMQNLIVPVGGGGLSSGMCYYLKAGNPLIRTIGCQHIGSPAFKLSLERGRAVTKLPAVETVAGGIEGGIGEKCFEILKDRLDEITLLTEREIIEGFRWMLENHQYLIEPTSAVAIAGCLFHKVSALKGDTVIVLTGRNVSFTTMQKLIQK